VPGSLGKSIGVNYLLERRELGAINIGGDGWVDVDGTRYTVRNEEAIYIGMGEPHETRHILVHNEQAVISPNWSIHSGVGTRAYTFIWGMVGENQVFGDMDHVAVRDLR
jgi:5-keto 4-deoxyuronate isomerase